MTFGIRIFSTLFSCVFILDIYSRAISVMVCIEGRTSLSICKYTKAVEKGEIPLCLSIRNNSSGGGCSVCGNAVEPAEAPSIKGITEAEEKVLCFSIDVRNINKRGP